MKKKLLVIIISVIIIYVAFKIVPVGLFSIGIYFLLFLVACLLEKFSETKVFNSFKKKVETIRNSINLYIENKIGKKISSNLLSFIQLTINVLIYSLPINIVFLLTLILTNASTLHIVTVMIAISFFHIFLLFLFGCAVGMMISNVINFILTISEPLIFWIDLSFYEIEKISYFIGSLITIVGGVILAISYLKKDNNLRD